jgi:hypothetical protein
MSEQPPLDIYLYGKLRRFAQEREPDAESVLHVPVLEGDTIASVVQRQGIPLEELGLNIFLNWQYSALDRPVHAGDRLALFPDDMQLLYKWYFEKVHE